MTMRRFLDDPASVPAPGRRRWPGRRWLSGTTASTVMGLGLFKYVDPWLIEEYEAEAEEAGPVAEIPRPLDGSKA